MMKYFILAVLLGFHSSKLLCQKLSGQLDSLFKTVYKEKEPGAAIAIQCNGKIIFKKSYGLANLQTMEKINAHTNFNIGSLTKQFTAYSVLLLEKQGKLSLDDKLIKYFPDFNPSTGNIITIRHLLSHSSGIEDHYTHTDTSRIHHATDKDVLAAVKNIGTTYFPPGTHYRYSNTAYCILAMIIEKVSGYSYANFIQKNIFDPLEMKHSTVFNIGSSIRHRALGYDMDSSDNKKFHRLDADDAIFFSTEGDGGIYTSVDDYLKWISGLQTGNILDRSLITKAGSAQFEIDPSKQLAYGFGWFVGQDDTLRMVYHTGSNGGFRAICFRIPSQQFAIVIFSNRTGVDLEDFVPKISRICHIDDKSFIKISSLVSFLDCCPIFAPCKEIPLYSTSFIKNLNASAMVLN